MKGMVILLLSLVGFVAAEFTCGNGKVLKDIYLCDGVSQCDTDECNCGDKTFVCDSDQCVSTLEVCDNSQHCKNGLDECDCGIEKFHCDNGRCIPTSWRCDGHKDCRPQGDDEFNCNNKTFYCKLDNKFIPESFLCDGDVDCTGGWDECNCGNKTFKCGNNECVSIKQVCDGVKNCKNNADEIGCSNATFLCQKNEFVNEDKLCDGFKDCKNGYDECGCKNSFQCRNGECLPAKSVCNNYKECSNGEDECNCPTTFKCSETECISNVYLCDNFFDCSNGVDECVCNNTAYFKCPHDGKCIPSVYICDGYVDCLYDGFDECNCGNETFKCGDKCIPSNFVCDGYKDCDLGQDECHCGNGTFMCSKNECVSNKEVCNGKSECSNEKDEADDICPKFSCDGDNKINVVQYCDGTVHCTDGSDEVPYFFTLNRTSGIKCPSSVSPDYSCFLDNSFVCDNVSHCLYGIDECFCKTDDDTGHVTNKCFKCFDGSTFLIRSQVCDRIIQCEDMSDECFCQYPIPICNSRCKESSTEISCYEKSSSSLKTCAKVCDGVTSCSNNEDETYCVRPQKTNLFQTYYKYNESQRLLCCNGITGCDDSELDYNCSSLYTCQRGVIGDYNTPLRAFAGDGIPTCGGGDDEKFTFDKVAEECKILDDNGNRLLKWEILCNGVADCRNGYDEKKEFCDGRFFCENPSIGAINIRTAEVCDGVSNCEDKSDEKYCSNKTHFYCKNSPKTIDAVFYVTNEKVCDGKIDCSDGSDECQACTFSPFSDDNNLISVVVAAVFIWFSGIASVLGNVLQVLKECRGLMKNYKILSSNRIVNNLHMISLACSDLCVGIYLILLIIKHHMFSGKYCLEDRKWRSSLQCSVMGALAFVGSEMSIFNLTLISIYRLRVVMGPSAHDHRVGLAVLVLIVAWIIGILVSVIPILPNLQDYFIQYVQYKDNLFVGLINKTENSKIFSQLVYYEDDLQDDSVTNKEADVYSWDEMFSGMKIIDNKITPQYKYGYYSSHGVCLGNLFPKKTDSTFVFSIAVITINLVCFIVMMTNYGIIYRYTRGLNQMLQSKDGNARLRRLQSKMLWIVGTDCCCWVPICIISYLQIAGVEISNDLYAVAAVVLIPINSVLNPFIYSDLPDYLKNLILKKTKPTASKLSSTRTRSTVVLSSRI